VSEAPTLEVQLDEAPRDFKPLLAAIDPALILDAAGGAATLAELRKLFLEQDFVDFAGYTIEEQSRFAFVLRKFAERLLSFLEQPRQELALIKLQRWTRLGALSLLAAVSVAVGLFLADLREQTRDLARDKSYRLSSSGVQGCPTPLQFCDESPGFFFHTNEETDPWIEIDLGAPRQFSAVRVVNRRDCCPERASPLLIEVSTDQKQFKKVAERSGPFGSWKATFDPVIARWVRVRLKGPQRILHLAGVRVLP
jgi:hypothetical protein